jgi:hypothetical protein
MIPREDDNMPLEDIEKYDAGAGKKTMASNLDQHLRELQPLPRALTSRLTKLPKTALTALLRKHRWLKNYTIRVPKGFEKHNLGVDATLVFVQEEGGTAVSVSPDGYLLTCAHFIAEDAQDFEESLLHWLVFRSGRVVGARCVAIDHKQDLALLRIITAQPSTPGCDDTRPGSGVDGRMEPFPCVKIAASQPVAGSRLVCTGHPGSEDLEASQPGVKTNYGILRVSTGTYQGCAKGQDPQENSEIGALQHTCWTYWGHSGAPLLLRTTGELMGLHSSWDDETAMRRGVHLDAIRAFLFEHKQLLETSLVYW